VQRNRDSCAHEICALTGAPYYVPDRAPSRVGFAMLTMQPNGSLAVNAAGVSATLPTGPVP
jgi:hypothetical protein